MPFETSREGSIDLIWNAILATDANSCLCPFTAWWRTQTPDASCRAYSPTGKLDFVQIQEAMFRLQRCCAEGHSFSFQARAARLQLPSRRRKQRCGKAVFLAAGMYESGTSTARRMVDVGCMNTGGFRASELRVE